MSRLVNQLRLAAIEFGNSRKMSVIAISAVIFCLALAVNIYRTEARYAVPGEFVDLPSNTNNGLLDFHNAVYFPTKDFLDGNNPYQLEFRDRHPDHLGFPLFSPITLLIHSPVVAIPLRAAEYTYVTAMAILYVVLSALVSKLLFSRIAWPLSFWLATFLIMSRPGLLNFNLGQVTLPIAIGCLLALGFGRKRPEFAAVGLALSSIKPTFTIPIALVMLCRREYRAVILGFVISFVGAFLPIIIISLQNGGLGGFVDDLIKCYGNVESHPEVPDLRKSWVRLDFYAVLARWLDVSSVTWLKFLVPAGLLGIGCCSVLCERSKIHRTDPAGRVTALALVMTLVAIYHNAYDCLILALPITALGLGKSPMFKSHPKILGNLLLVLLLFPMINYVSTNMIMMRFGIEPPSLAWTILATVNGLALLGAYLLLIYMIWSDRAQSSKTNVEAESASSG